MSEITAELPADGRPMEGQSVADSTPIRPRSHSRLGRLRLFFYARCARLHFGCALLDELVPQATVIAALVDPNFLTTADQFQLQPSRRQCHGRGSAPVKKTIGMR